MRKPVPSTGSRRVQAVRPHDLRGLGRRHASTVADTWSSHSRASSKGARLMVNSWATRRPGHLGKRLTGPGHLEDRRPPCGPAPRRHEKALGGVRTRWPAGRGGRSRPRSPRPRGGPRLRRRGPSTSLRPELLDEPGDECTGQPVPGVEAQGRVLDDDRMVQVERGDLVQLVLDDDAGIGVLDLREVEAVAGRRRGTRPGSRRT